MSKYARKNTSFFKNKSKRWTGGTGWLVRQSNEDSDQRSLNIIMEALLIAEGPAVYLIDV